MQIMNVCLIFAVSVNKIPQDLMLKYLFSSILNVVAIIIVENSFNDDKCIECLDDGNHR